MLEIVIGSLFVGSLGVQAVLISGWMRFSQIVIGQDEEEEEILTQYEAKENATEQSQLGGMTKHLPKENPRLTGWEFKIVRANHHLFRDPAVLQRLCQEEAQAGWILLEKLDDRRIRFKRPIAMRDMIKPESLPYDPYRCHYGSSWHPLAWFGILAVLGAIVLPAYLAYALVSQTLAPSNSNPLPANFPTPEQPPSP